MAVVIITGEKEEASSHKKRATKSGWGGPRVEGQTVTRGSLCVCPVWQKLNNGNSYFIISLDKEKENNSDFVWTFEELGAVSSYSGRYFLC